MSRPRWIRVPTVLPLPNLLHVHPHKTNKQTNGEKPFGVTCDVNASTWLTLEMLGLSPEQVEGSHDTFAVLVSKMTHDIDSCIEGCLASAKKQTNKQPLTFGNE